MQRLHRDRCRLRMSHRTDAPVGNRSQREGEASTIIAIFAFSAIVLGFASTGTLAERTDRTPRTETAFIEQTITVVVIAIARFLRDAPQNPQILSKPSSMVPSQSLSMRSHSSAVGLVSVRQTTDRRHYNRDALARMHRTGRSHTGWVR